MISGADERILLFLHRLHYATVDQIVTRYYAPTSKSTVQIRLKGLWERDYVQRLSLPRRATAGSSPFVYFLGRRGRAVLDELGYRLGRYRPSEHHNRSLLFLDHTLAVNDVLIGAELASEEKEIELRDYVHEREMRQRLRGVIPDAWLDVVTRGYRYPILLEVDQGTIDRARVQEKVHGLLDFVEGDYQRLFDATAAVFAFVAPDKRRADNLINWIAAVTTGETFFVTAAAKNSSLFTSDVWTQVSSGKTVSLYE